MKNGKKGSANSIQSPIGGRDSDNLQPRQAGCVQHPAAEDLQAQDSFFSNMRQIGFNKPNRGGYSPCVTAHYHKVGWKDILNANQIPHFGILVIDEPDTDKLSQRLFAHADEPSL